MIFQWDEKNVQHIGSHDVVPEEAEEIVLYAEPPFPREIGDDKLVVWGRTQAGRYLQVIFVHKESDDVDFRSLSPTDLAELSEQSSVAVARIVHAMDLTPKLLKQYRRMYR